MGVVPLVAVTTTSVPEAAVDQGMTVQLDARYVTVLERLGFACVLVSPAHDPISVRALLSLCNGLVLTGGEDVDPCFYGEKPVAELGGVNPTRDVVELAALEAALERRLPVLAICRGCQLLNVHFGGTLYQDLDTQMPGEIRHRQAEPWFAQSHRVRLEADSILCGLIHRDELMINSFHHQAVKDLAEDLRATGRAEDGLIEAVELAEPDGRWVLGVQWHPERHQAHTPDEDPDRRIFAGFREQVLRFSEVAA